MKRIDPTSGEEVKKPRVINTQGKIRTPSKLELEIMSRCPALEYEPEAFIVNIARRYTPDFILTDGEGIKCIIEAKGFLRREEVTSYLHFIEQYIRPLGWRFMMVWKIDSKVQGTDSRMSEWCRRNRVEGYQLDDLIRRWGEVFRIKT